MNNLQIRLLADCARNEARFLPSFETIARHFVELENAKVPADNVLHHLKQGLLLMLDWDAKEIRVLGRDPSVPLFTASLKECQVLLNALEKAKFGSKEFNLDLFIETLHQFVHDEQEKWRRVPITRAA